MRTETTIYKELLRQIKIFEEESTKKEYNICLNTLKGRIEALCFVLSVNVPEQIYH